MKNKLLVEFEILEGISVEDFDSKDWIKFERFCERGAVEKLKEEVEEHIKELIELTGETREDILNNIIGRIQSKNKI